MTNKMKKNAKGRNLLLVFMPQFAIQLELYGKLRPAALSLSVSRLSLGSREREREREREEREREIRERERERGKGEREMERDSRAQECTDLLVHGVVDHGCSRS
jgi:hypothetical protein